MATYCVTTAPDDNWGESRNRFKNRPEADARFEEMRSSNAFVRLVRWDDNVPTEVRREDENSQIQS